MSYISSFVPPSSITTSTTAQHSHCTINRCNPKLFKLPFFRVTKRPSDYCHHNEVLFSRRCLYFERCLHGRCQWRASCTQ